MLPGFVAIWSVPCFAKASFEERRLKEFQGVVQVVAQDDGGALVVTRGEPGLVRITPDGQWEAFPFPELGVLIAAATRGGEIWLLGSQRIQHRTDQGQWKGFDLPADFPCVTSEKNPDGSLMRIGVRSSLNASEVHCPGRDAHDDLECTILATDAGKAASACSDPRPKTSALLFLDAEVGVLERIALPQVESFVVAPARNAGLHAFVRNEDNRHDLRGYLEVGGGRGVLRYWGDRSLVALPHLEFQLLQPEPTLSKVTNTSEDGKGGFYGAVLGDLVVHVDQDFAVRKMNVPRGMRNGRRLLVRDDTSGDLLVFTASWDDPWIHLAGELSRVNAKGRIVDTQLVPVARDLKCSTSCPPNSFSAAAGRIWIASENYVLRKSGKTWTYYTRPKFGGEWQDDPAILGLLRLGGGTSGAALTVAAGAWWASNIHGERYWTTAGQVAGGTLLAMGGSLEHRTG